MAAEQQRLTPAERSNLVAYIDGELDDAESRVIATKLTKSPTARREVELLERTWEMLDLLPRPKASEKLTVRTLTEIRQLSVAGEEFESALKQTVGKVAHAAFWIVASAAAMLVGFAITQWVWPNPTARLARELTIAEHLDEYRDVGSFDFLEALARSPEFSSDQE